MSYQTPYRAQDLTFGSLFKIMFVAGTGFWLILGVIISLLALVGLQTVTWNDQYVTGLPGFFIGLVISGLLGLLFSCFGALFLALILKWFGGILPISFLRVVREMPSEPRAASQSDSTISS